MKHLILTLVLLISGTAKADCGWCNIQLPPEEFSRCLQRVMACEEQEQKIQELEERIQELEDKE